jgi:hypothetical protein
MQIVIPPRLLPQRLNAAPRLHGFGTTINWKNPGGTSTTPASTSFVTGDSGTGTGTSTPQAQSAKEMAIALIDERAIILAEVKPLLDQWADYLPAKYDKTWKNPAVAAALIDAPAKLKPLVTAMAVSDPQLLTIVPGLQAARVELIQLRDLLKQIKKDNTPAEDLEDQINDAIDTVVTSPALIVGGLVALGLVVWLVNRR